MRAAPVFALALVVASGARAQAPEAIAFDAPVKVVGEDGSVRVDAPDGGLFLTPPAVDKLNTELKRLQAVEQAHVDAPPPTMWLVVGSVLGGVITLGVVGSLYALTR